MIEGLFHFQALLNKPFLVISLPFKIYGIRVRNIHNLGYVYSVRIKPV